MANGIKMAVRDSILTLYDKGWSQRRIAREPQIDRETVGRYVRLAAAEAIPVISPRGVDGRSGVVGGSRSRHFAPRVGGVGQADRRHCTAGRPGAAEPLSALPSVDRGQAGTGADGAPRICDWLDYVTPISGHAALREATANREADS